MELINASELARQTGLSTATVGYHVKAGTFPTHEDSNGRRRFIASEVLEVMEREGIKPRPRKDKEQPEEAEVEAASQPEEEESAESPIPTDAADILRTAIKRARSAFKRTLVEEINRKLNDDEAPLDQENELVALRFHLRADEVFDALRQELVG